MGFEKDETKKKTREEREELFCILYAKCFNKTQAAVDAGYGRKKDGSVNRRSAAVAACRLMEKEHIKKRIESLFSNAVNEAGATPFYIIDSLKTVAERCLQEIKPKMEWDSDEKKWVETGEFTFNAKGATGALKTLADIAGLCSMTANIKNEGEIDMTLSVIDGKNET